jgi:predicted TIM-barrel fold metal-dependent hydrolase
MSTNGLRAVDLAEGGRGPGILANAARQAAERGLNDMVVVDADAHHYEERSLTEIFPFIENPTIRRRAVNAMARPGRGGIMPHGYGNQDVAGRIRPSRLRSDDGVPARDGVPRFLSEYHHAMDQMGIDYSVMFPTTMLSVGMHPEREVEVEICRAYANWMTECVLPCDDAVLTMLPLPFNDARASLELIERHAGRKGVAGFMVTSVRDAPVHHRKYLKVYAALQERGLPLGFHSATHWEHQAQAQFNRFISVHALGFPLFNIIHLINMVVNGIPESFPDLKLLWIEAGVAWIPFVMQRLDNEYMMRSSEAPRLTRKPSEYMRDFFYTTQPLEGGDRDFLEATFRLIHGETQLLYASDYPHWDFDLPSRVYDLPFLSAEGKRRILGENALALFGLKRPEKYATAAPAPASAG